LHKENFIAFVELVQGEWNMGTKLAKILGTETYVVLDASMESVLGLASSLKDAEDIQESIAAKSFDFEAVWKAYPRKLGKASGMKWLRANIRSQNRFERLKCAVENYREYCQKNDTDEKYIQHFSTWVKRFEDWVLIEAPQPIQSSQTRSIEDELLKHGLFL
jgi:hypothetical protein